MSNNTIVDNLNMSSGEGPGTRQDISDEAYLTGLREQMLKFARLQLKEESAAEDAVQEALLGAMKNVDSFGARSALKTWVFAILRNKIADFLRKKMRSREMTNVMGEESDQGIPDLFSNTGAWRAGEAPIAWGDPEQTFKQDRFWQVFEVCLNGLPEAQARVFMMREFIGLSGSDICSELQLNTSNLHVLLYRARMRLRECLENRWFSTQ